MSVNVMTPVSPTTASNQKIIIRETY